MLNKKVLGVAVAAMLGSNAANAVIDFDNPTTPGSVSYAVETLISTATTTGADMATYYNVVGAGAALNAQGAIGVGVSNGDQIFIRYDFPDSALSAAAPVLTTGGGTFNQSQAQGGSAGDDFVIYTLTATADIAQTDVLTIPLAGHAVSGTGGGSIRMRVYETLTNASSNDGDTGALTDKTVTNAISTVAGFTDSASPAVATAEVEDDFMLWANGSNSGLTNNFGSHSITANANAVAQGTGAPVTLGDMLLIAPGPGNSALTINGDFATGTAYFLDADGNATDCDTTSTALTPAMDEMSAATDFANFPPGVDVDLCMTVDGMTVIPESLFNSDSTLLPVANAVFPQASTEGDAAGTIDHNGTTVQLPYLTTFSDYNQRIVMVNRGPNAAAYTLSFTPEAGTTATPGAAASGVLAGDETTIIKVSDTVTLSGNTRTAGTLVVVSPNGSIDVVTTQVNLADGGTDTVNYK